jgi:hypothetical protein
VGDRGLLASARHGFVDRAFGMKSCRRSCGATVSEGLFDFSSTTATRVMARWPPEGSTPFMGAGAQAGWRRPADGSCHARWTRNVNAGLPPRGTVVVVATDPGFLKIHQTT